MLRFYWQRMRSRLSRPEALAVRDRIIEEIAARRHPEPQAPGYSLRMEWRDRSHGLHGFFPRLEHAVRSRDHAWNGYVGIGRLPTPHPIQIIVVAATYEQVWSHRDRQRCWLTDCPAVDAAPTPAPEG
ncbi:hypothetical protein [Plantactinospora sp. GCM10030261]|uniref:hypothetical protein n=1 Tax=Plantactinospora sp. GCM10030261 TaxID=3273420 RepID=UPI00360A87DC